MAKSKVAHFVAHPVDSPAHRPFVVCRGHFTLSKIFRTHKWLYRGGQLTFTQLMRFLHGLHLFVHMDS